jgi:hypothetical protein
MCGSPDGYGSISSTYEWSTPAPGSLGTSHVRSSSQTFCHLGSMRLGSYRSMRRLRLSAGFRRTVL